MPSIHEPARRRVMIERLARLRPDSRAEWGRFTATRMVLHLIESLRMASGELPVRPRRLPLLFLLRPLVIYVLPFPKSAPTGPELLRREPGTWEDDIALLRGLIDAQVAPPPGTAMVPHPAFGEMSARDWGHIIHKHLDHHFRQFGI